MKSFDNLARWLLIIGGCDGKSSCLPSLKLAPFVIKRRSSVRKSLGFENTLYVLSVILSLAFVSLVILSLAITPLWAREPAEARQSIAFRLWQLHHWRLQPAANQPVVWLKKASGHDEVLRRARENLSEKIRRELSNAAELRRV